MDNPGFFEIHLLPTGDRLYAEGEDEFRRLIAQLLEDHENEDIQMRVLMYKERPLLAGKKRSFK